MNVSLGYSRLCALGVILIGIGLLALAAWDYFAPGDGPGVFVDEPEREILGCSAGQTSVVIFPIHNPTRHPVWVVGLEEC